MTKKILQEAAAADQTPHLRGFADSVRVAHIAQAICDVISTQTGASRFVQLAELTVVERRRMLDAATIALRSFNRSAVSVAQLRAAQALGLAQFGQSWFRLTDAEQAHCRERVTQTLDDYSAHLRGVTDATRELRLVPPSDGERAEAVQS